MINFQSCYLADRSLRRRTLTRIFLKNGALRNSVLKLALISQWQWGAGTYPISISQRKCKYEVQLFHNGTVVSSMNKDRARGGKKGNINMQGYLKSPISSNLKWAHTFKLLFLIQSWRPACKWRTIESNQSGSKSLADEEKQWPGTGQFRTGF